MAVGMGKSMASQAERGGGGLRPAAGREGRRGIPFRRGRAASGAMDEEAKGGQSAAAGGAAARAGGGRAPLLFEIAWEVCQQLGGIYTVLRSKAPTMVQRWGKRYFLVGPYNADLSGLEFEEHRPAGPVGRAVRALQAEGIDARWGRWLVTGQPQTVLLNGDSVWGRLDEIKYFLWEHHGIACGDGGSLPDEVLAFGHIVERLFRRLLEQRGLSRPVVAHFHEWMGAAAIPELRRARLGVGIVFTTHATLLGRYLATGDAGFHDRLGQVDWRGEARRLNIEPAVLLERAAAAGAHVLTTVSEVTGEECRHLLGRSPDVLLPNGLNIERFAAVHEFQNLHRVYKDRIHRFVMGQFFPSYTFDLDRTLYFFSAGRCEYRNKGFDLVLESLARLNAALRGAGERRTVVFFLITQRPYRQINSQVLHRSAMLEELRRNCEAIREQFGERLFEACARGQAPDYNALVDDYWRLRLRRLMHARRAAALPLVVTHDLLDDAGDEVLRQIRYLNLVNNASDAVKVVYHPDFVSAAGPLFGMDYDQFVRGCHLGIFPSFYEPWGYTPLECVARGVPAVTSDLSGFGTYVGGADGGSEGGIYVLPRRGRSFDEAAAQLAAWLLEFCRMGRRERIAQRNRVEARAEQFDWQRLADNYDTAHRLAARYCGT